MVERKKEMTGEHLISIACVSLTPSVGKVDQHAELGSMQQGEAGLPHLVRCLQCGY